MAPLLNIHQLHDRSVVVRLRDKTVLRYLPNRDGFRPYLSELRTLDGYNVLGDAPMDNPHHHGIWLGHRDVNGINFWTEEGGEGKICHREVLAKISGEDRGIFSVMNDWIAPDGKKILEDELTYVVHQPSEYGIEVDLLITLRATDGDVKFGPNQAFGFPQIRMTDYLAVRRGGCITNSDGMVNEAATSGKKAAWCDYSGPREDGQYVGLAVYDHPTNPEHPATWCTRDHGSFAPSFLALGGGAALKAGEELILLYRLYVHEGTALRSRVSREHDQYLEMIAKGRRVA